MPNWCNNYVTLTGPKEKIDELIIELKKADERDETYQILNTLRPKPEGEEDWYMWNVNHWGTKWDVSIAGYEIIDENTVSLSFDSAWAPPIALYEFLESEDWSVDAFYNEEGMGFCGRYFDGFDDSYEYAGMSADDIEGTLPEELDEMFNISGYRREEEELEEEDE
jgi:hypothetical protein